MSQRESTRLHPMFVDSHCHLDLVQFEEDRRAVYDRAMAADVRAIIAPGIDLAQCRAALALSDEYPGLYVAVGIHPNSSDQFETSTLDELQKLAEHPKVVAIGEIGLDYYWDKVEPAQQANAFRAQLDLAASLGLPVIIHNRDAHTDVATVLQDWAQSSSTRCSPLANRPFWGVLHAFGGDLALAHQAYDWNFVLGLGGPVTFKNARELHALVPQLDPERMMIETDAPYLTPHPHRGQRNEPAYVTLVAAKLAALLEQPLSEIAEKTTSVALQFYGISRENQRSSESSADERVTAWGNHGPQR